MASFYGTVDNFLTYCEERGYETESYSPSPSDDIEAALVVASNYIDIKYRGRFSGTRVGGRLQEREWPRLLARDGSNVVILEDEIPIEVEHATYEAARRHIAEPGSLMPDWRQSERVTREQVGPLSVSYADSTAADAWPILGIIDGLLAPLLGARASSLFGETFRI